MQAKDTRILKDEVDFCNKDMDAQAKISFKAGIQTVVDWIDNHAHKQHGEIFIADWELQAQLKIWGVSPPEGK